MKEENNNYITYFEDIIDKVDKKYPDYNKEQIRHLIANHLEYIKHLMLQDDVCNINIPNLSNLYFKVSIAKQYKNKPLTEEGKKALADKVQWVVDGVKEKLSKNPKTKGNLSKSLHMRRSFQQTLRKMVNTVLGYKIGYINHLKIYEKAAKIQHKIHSEHS